MPIPDGIKKHFNKSVSTTANHYVKQLVKNQIGEYAGKSSIKLGAIRLKTNVGGVMEILVRAEL